MFHCQELILIKQESILLPWHGRGHGKIKDQKHIQVLGMEDSQVQCLGLSSIKLFGGFNDFSGLINNKISFCSLFELMFIITIRTLPPSNVGRDHFLLDDGWYLPILKKLLVNANCQSTHNTTKHFVVKILLFNLQSQIQELGLLGNQIMIQ